MNGPIGGIDHCIILVRDLAAARLAWEAMGFRTSPIGRHPDHMGTANHTIMLADTYLELLGVLKETEANARWRAALPSPTAVPHRRPRAVGAAPCRWPAMARWRRGSIRSSSRTRPRPGCGCSSAVISHHTRPEHRA